MDSKTRDHAGTNPEDEAASIDTVELEHAAGGAAGSKTITTQGGGGAADTDADGIHENPASSKDIG